MVADHREQAHGMFGNDRDDACFYVLDGAGIEDYFREINAASGDDESTRIGARYGIRVVPG